MAQNLDTDPHGNVILKPVTGWTIGPVAEIAVLLRIEYLESPQSAASRGIQFVLTPQQSLELAETLTRAANKILQPPSDPKAM